MVTFDTTWKTQLLRTLLVVAGIAGVTSAFAQDKHIDVSVESSGGANKLVFLNSECPDRRTQKGCVLAERGSAPVISWRLDRESAGEWELVSLQFSPDGAHWGDPGHPLADCTVEAFRLSESDRASGMASSAQIPGQGEMLMIRDRNINVCLTHYLLTAQHRGSGEKIDSDPVIDNRGGALP